MSGWEGRRDNKLHLLKCTMPARAGHLPVLSHVLLTVTSQDQHSHGHFKMRQLRPRKVALLRVTQIRSDGPVVLTQYLWLLT